MANRGLGTGLKQGVLQGVKTGLGYAPMRSGYIGGVNDGNTARDKIQDPTLLTGNKKPLIFCNADNLTTNTGAVITMADLVGSGYSLTQPGGSSLTPDLITNDIFNLRDSLDFNGGQTALYPTPSLNFNGDTALSMMMVIKLKAVTQQIVYINSSTEPGGIDLQLSDANRTIRSIFYGGEPGSVTNSQYDSVVSEAEREDYMILTCKYRLAQPGGSGSEQEMHINGTLRRKLFSSNFNVVTTAWTAAQTLIVGNTAITGGSRGAGIYLGAFLLLDYWLNESEQLRLENYFRWYYGHKF